MSQNLIDKKVLKQTFFRSNLHQASWNFERMHALGFLYMMVPSLKKLYPDNDDDRKQAIARHLEFFNTQPFVGAPILGVTIAMEEQRKLGADIDDAMINGLKVGMMGPLAGIGDPIFWGTLRPVLGALAAGLAIEGNLLGPILFFVLFNVVRLGFRWWGLFYGFEKGTELIEDIGGGLLQKITVGASVLGLFIMGALINMWTNVNLSFIISSIENPDTGELVNTTMQMLLDDLILGLVPLLLTFLSMKLLDRKISPLWLILSFFVLGIVGYALGIMS